MGAAGCVLLLLGCGSSREARAPDAAPDAASAMDAASPPDGARGDADAGSDAAEPDAADPGRCDAGAPDEPAWFAQAGSCYAQTPRCCSDADCDPGLYDGCIPEGSGYPSISVGHCRADVPCACVLDADCPEGAICVTNQRVCGACVVAEPECATDAECAAGQRCLGRYCVGACPSPPCTDDAECDDGQRCLRDVTADARRCAPVTFAEDPLHCERDSDCRSCVPSPPACCDQLPAALVARNRYSDCEPRCCTCSGPCTADAPWAPGAICVAGRCELVPP